jgi:hypothetical protein
VGHGGGAEGASLDGLGQGLIELGGAVEIEEAEEGLGVASQRLPALGQLGDEGLGMGTSMPETIAAPKLMRMMFLTGERGEMRGLFDALTPIPASGVTSDLARGIEGCGRSVHPPRGSVGDG